MLSTKRRSGFLDTEEGQDVKRQLLEMASSKTFNTTSTYSADNEMYPNHKIPFVDKHLNYLINHPKLEPSKYIANLKLMSRIRR